MNNIIFTFWNEGFLDEFTKLSVRSWLKLGYEVEIYMYSEPEYVDVSEFDDDEVTFLDAADIIPKPPLQSPAEISDYFRFNYLFSEGGTWVDSDLILLRRISENELIISSEHARQCNCYSPKDRDWTANIGVLRFPKYSLLLLNTITKMNSAINRGLKTNSNRNNLMKIFQRIVHNDFRELVSPPNDFCPISWSYAKEIYMENDIICKGKFGIKQKNMQWILENAYGIHLWRNLAITKGYFNNKRDDSVYNLLKYFILG